MRQTRSFLIPAFLFVTTFAAYLATLCPTVYVGDSPEFITNAVTLGINHPTGYPLYTLISRFIVMLLPLWTPAIAMNAFSASAASLCVVCVYLILHVLVPRTDVTAVTALLFGFSQTLWARATTAEVYTFNALFVALTLFSALQWNSSADRRYLLLTGYLVGLGLTQHVTGVLVAVSIGAFMLVSQPRLVLRPRMALALTAAVVLGMSSYFYLPIRSLANPPLDWGDPETFGRMASFLYPAGEKSPSAFFSGGGEARLLWFIQQALVDEFWYFGLLAILGLLLLATHWRLLLLTGLLVGLNVAFTIARKLPVHADFDAHFIPSYLALSLLIGVALSRVLQWLERAWGNPSGRMWKVVTTLVLSLIPSITFLVNFRQNDKSHTYFGEDFGRNLFSPVEKNAIVFTKGDEQTFLGWYFKYTEKSRPDLTVVDTRLLGLSWGVRQTARQDPRLPISPFDSVDRRARDIVVGNLGERAIYFTHSVPWDFLLKDFEIVHTGMLIQLLPKGSRLEYRPSSFSFHPGGEAEYLDERCKLLVDFYPKECLDNAQFWLNRGNITAAREELRSLFALPYPKQKEDLTSGYLLQSLTAIRVQRIEEAIAYADSALALNPADWRGYEYRGNFQFLAGDTGRAFTDWGRSLELNPSNPSVRHNVEMFSRRQPGVGRR